MYVSHYHLWSIHLYNISPPYLINGTIFRNVTEYKMCFDFLYNLSEIFLVLSRCERDIIKNVY